MQMWSELVSHREPLATVDGVNMSKKIMFFPSQKAQQALGYQARPVDDALRAAVNWFLNMPA